MLVFTIARGFPNGLKRNIYLYLQRFGAFRNLINAIYACIYNSSGLSGRSETQYIYIYIYIYWYLQWFGAFQMVLNALVYRCGPFGRGGMGPEGENHPLTTRRVRAEYADLHTHIISSTYKPAKSASKPASPQASKSAKCKQASQPQQASKQANARPTIPWRA